MNSAPPKIPGYGKGARTYVVNRNGYKIVNGMIHLSGAKAFGFQPVKTTVCEHQPFNAKADETVVTDIRIVPLGTSFCIEIGYTGHRGGTDEQSLHQQSQRPGS